MGNNYGLYGKFSVDIIGKAVFFYCNEKSTCSQKICGLHHLHLISLITWTKCLCKGIIISLCQSVLDKFSYFNLFISQTTGLIKIKLGRNVTWVVLNILYDFCIILEFKMTRMLSDRLEWMVLLQMYESIRNPRWRPPHSSN